jgi:hypothetical protein
MPVSEGDDEVVGEGSEPIPLLPREAVWAVRLLFRADQHEPSLHYSADGRSVAMRCTRCAATIRWQWDDRLWQPESSGYQAGRHCMPLFRQS